MLLVMYTFVFSVVFKARWGAGDPESKSEFAVLLFVGMIVHGLFSETLIRAPTLIIANVNFVKKIVFPLEVLPIIAMCTSVFHALASVGVLAGALLLLNGAVPWTIIYLPFVLLPLIVLTLGVAWILAWLGVFLRDVAQPIGLAMTVLLFASPVFYPISALPSNIQPLIKLNPLTFVIEQARAVIVFQKTPDWIGLIIYSIVAMGVAWLGYASFQKTRRGFANVL